MVLLKALQYLLENSEMNKRENITIDDTWIEKLNSMTNENDTYLDPDFEHEHGIQENSNMADAESQQDIQDASDNFNEKDVNKMTQVHTDTMLDGQHNDFNDLTYTFEPEEKKVPVFINH